MICRERSPVRHRPAADLVGFRSERPTTAIGVAQAQGSADGSPEMVAVVQAALEPAYGDWAMFEAWLPENAQGLVEIQAADGAATSAAGTPTP